MLQSSLDSVYQRIDSEQLAYEARLKATKDVTRELDKEIARIKKLRDDLAVKQLDKNAAAQQWTAGQRNAANRTEFLVKASNSRFLADKAADRAMYGTRDDTRAAGIPGLDEISENEANRSYTSFPDDPNAGLQDYRSKLSGTGEFAKSSQQRDLATAYAVDTYVANEIAKLDRGEGDPGVVAAYQDFAGDRAADIKPDLKAQKGIALRIVFDKITDPAIVESANRGYDIAETLSKKKGAGVSDEELAKMVYSGSIPVNQARPPDYSALRGELDRRLADLEMKRTEVTPEAPIPLSERDVIEEQRDEFFRTFYPGAKPAYQVNRLIDSILSGNLDPQSEAIIQEIISSEGKARRMPAEGPLGPEIENAGARRGFTGKEGARMAGDIIYGEGSPFTPGLDPRPDFARFRDRREDKREPPIAERPPLSDKALKILSNEGLNQFYGEGLSEAKIQKRANDLFALGLGMTKVTKEDGKVLYTVVPYNRLGRFKPEDVVMPTRPEAKELGGPEQALLNVPREDIQLTAAERARLGLPEEDTRLTQPTGVVQGQPLAATLLAAYTSAQDAIKKAAASGDKAATQAAIKDAMIVNEQLDKALKELGQTRADIEIEPRRLQPITGDRAEVRRIQPTTPIGERYKSPFKITEPPAPTLVPGSDQPPAGPAIRTPTGISYPSISPDVQQTPDGRDASFKINALESASKLVDNDELGRMLKTPVGSAVEQLYKANKAKGNQTNKELLSYIAKEFPRVEDQQTATTALFGLSYKDELSGKLG